MTKRDLLLYLDSNNVDIVGVGSVETFEERFPDRASPRRFLRSARSIIVIGFSYQPSTMWTVSHMDELAPFYDDPERSSRPEGKSAPFISHAGAACKWFIQDEKLILYAELNRVAFFLNRWIRAQGHEAFYFPVNTKDPVTKLAPFEHMRAAYIAGIGSIGDNCCILHPEYGSGIQFTTILTTAELPPDPIIDDVCIHCGTCIEVCPVGAISNGMQVDADRCYCCFRCIVNCPVGAKKKYRQD